MVAVFTGGGLGVANGSGYVLGSRGQLGQANLGRGGDHVYVNAATGNLIIQNRDELLIGRGPDSAISRTYNSQGTFTDDNGDNWRSNAAHKVAGLTGTVNTAGSTITRTDWDGSQTVYTYNATLTKYLSTASEGAYDTLSFAANVWTWTDGNSRVTESYDSLNSGRITSRTDSDGNSLTFAYGAGGQVSQVTSANGEITYLDYNGSNQLTQVRTSYTDLTTSIAKTLTRVRYGYDAFNRLSTVTIDLSPDDNSVTDAKTFVTTYTYTDTTNKRIASIVESDGSRLDVTYDASFRVQSFAQTAATGVTRTTSFSYNTQTRQTAITDPDYQQTVLEYDTIGQLIKISKSAVNSLTQYGYNSNGDVISQTDPAGNVTTYGYDSNGNLTLQRDHLGNTVNRTYGSKNELLTETRYATPDPDGAGSLLPSAPLTTRYAYDSANRLRYAVSAEGRVTEYRYNGYGQQTSVISYAANIYDVSALAETATIAEASLNSWVTGITDKSGTLRADTSYDARGNISDVTRYEKVLASGAGDTATTVSKTVYIYDQYGNLLKRQPTYGSSASEIYLYDGLGRLLSSTDLNNAVTSWQYDDANTKTVVTLASNLVQTSIYNKAGELISFVESSGATTLATTNFYYDKLGRLRRTVNPTGVSTHILYDAVGRKVADIDADGSLTEYVYNNRNLLVRSIRYATLVTPTQLASLYDASGNPTTTGLDGQQGTGIRPVSTDNDRWEWRIYDNADRLIETINALGAVTVYEYDGASRLVKTTAYANVIATATVMGFKTTQPTALVVPTADMNNDRVTRTFYDKDDRLTGSLDGEGYLTQQLYDKAGQKIKTIRYANATAAGNRAAGIFATLLTDVTATVNPKDIHNYYIYDARGLLAAEVDGEGNVTLYHYNQYGDLDSQVRGRKLDPATLISTPPTLASATAAPGSVLETISYTRNAYGQPASQTITLTGGGTETSSYTYDAMRRLLTAKTAAGLADERITTRRYDVQGRVVGELTGEGSAALVALGASPTQTQIDSIYQAYGIISAYDAAGRLISRTAPNGVDGAGNKTLYYYNSDGNLTHVINALGEVTEYRYTNFNQQSDAIRYGTRIAAATLATLTGGLVNTTLTTAVTAITNAALDSKTHLDFDLTGQVQQSIDALGYATTYGYNSFLEEISRTSPTNGANTVFNTTAYTQRGLVKSSTVDSGGLSLLSQFGYDAFGRLVQTTDARGINRSNGYDRAGRIVTMTDGLSSSQTTTYDALSNVLTRSDKRGNVTTYATTAFNRQTTITTAEGVATTIKRNAYGQTISIKDGRNIETTYSYDKDGNLKTSTDSSGSLNLATTNSYDKAGRILETTDPRGIKTAFTYDAANRVLTRKVDSASGGLALMTTYQYDAKGQVITTTDPSGVVTQVVYDLAGQKTSVITNPGGLNLTTTYSYDKRGKVLTVTEAAGTATQRVTQYTYDKAGRLTKTQVDPGSLNLTTQYVYDANGNAAARIDALNNVTRYVYDAENRLIYTVDPLGGVIKTDYDADGNVSARTAFANVISLTSPSVLGNAITTADITGRLTIGASDQKSVMVYDRDSRLKYSIDALGLVTEYVYDASGNRIRSTVYVTAITVPATPSVANVQPLLASVPASDRSSRAIFDTANRQAFSIDATGAVTAFAYDSGGNVIKQTGYAALYGPTADPDLATMQSWVTGNANATNDRVTRFVYDAAGRQVYSVDPESYVQESQYNAVGQRTKSIRYAAKYSVADGVTQASMKTTILPASIPADAAVASYAYDTAGRLTDTTDALGVITHLVLDAQGQITDTYLAWGTGDQAQTRRVFDAAGRMTSETRKGATVAEDSTTSYAYDGMGRATLITNPRSFTTAKVYNANGQVTQVTIQLDASTNAVTTTQYDALGNAVKVTDPRLNAGYFYFDKLNRLTLQIDPEGYATKTDYTVFGKAASVTRFFAKPTGTGSVTTLPTLVLTAGQDAATNFTYDKLDRLTQTTDAENGIESYILNAFGDRTQVTNKLGGVTVNVFDKKGQLIQQTQSILNPVTGLTSTIINKQEYDARSNRTKLIEAFGATEQRTTLFIYDLLDRQTDKKGDAITVQNLDGTSTTGMIPTDSRVYDKRGNVIQTIDANLAKTFSYYDKADRKIAEINAVGSLTLWSYDAAGNVTSKRTYGDTFALPATPGGAAPTTASTNYRETLFAYDRNNRLITATNFAGATSTSYDAAGNVIMQTDALGNKFFIFYNKLGQKTAQVDQERYLTTYALDKDGNVTTETRYAKPYNIPGDPTAANIQTWTGNAANLSASEDRITLFTYDRNGRRLSQARQNVVAVTTVTSAALTAAPLEAKILFEYNKLGQIIKKTEANGDYTTYSFDNLGRQTRVQTKPYTDFESGSATPTTDTAYNGLNLITSTSQRGKVAADDRVTTYTYGAGGRLASSTDPLGQVTNYYYDAVGRLALRSYQRTASDGVTTKWNGNFFGYDALGREVRRFTAVYNSGTSWTRGDTTDMLYNPFGDAIGRGINVADADVGNAAKYQEFAEYDKAGRVWRTNFNDGVTKAYVYDANGNAIGLIQSTGAQDLRSYADINAITTDSSLAKTASLYDKRNQLVDTVQPTATNDGAKGISFSPASNGTNGSSTTTTYLNTTAAVIAPPANYGGQNAPVNSQASGLVANGAGSVTFRGFHDLIAGVRPGYERDAYRIMATLTQIARRGGGNLHVFINDSGGFRDIGQFSAATDILFIQKLVPFFDMGSPITISVYQDAPLGSGMTLLAQTTMTVGSAPNYYGDVTQIVSVVPVIQIQSQNPSATNLLMFARMSGSGPYRKITTTQLTNSANNPIAGWFTADMSQFANGTTNDIIYYALDASGNTFNAQSATLTVDASGNPTLSSITPLNIGGAGTAIVTREGSADYLIVSEQPAGTASAIMHYYAGGVWNKVVLNNSGYGQAGQWHTNITGWGGPYDYFIDSYNSSGALINTARGTFTAGGTASGLTQYQSIQNQQIVTINFPTSGLAGTISSARVRYAASGSGAWSGWVALSGSGTTYTWDGSGLVNDNYDQRNFDYQVEAYAGSTLLDQASGTVSFGYNRSISNGTGSSFTTNVSAKIEIIPSQPTVDGDTLQISWRPAGSTGAYKLNTLTRVAGKFEWDIASELDVNNAPMRPAPGITNNYEYYYDVYRGGTAVPTINGEDHARGTLSVASNAVIIASTSVSSANWVIDPTSINTPYTVHRAQARNAFGEISSETNGNGFITSFTYNSMGKLIKKVSPQVTVVDRNGNVNTTATPTEEYYYDLTGRLVGTKDANGNQNSLVLLAGSGQEEGAKPIILKEYHADGGIKNYGVDIFGQLRTSTNEIGAKTDYLYDKNGQLTQVTHPLRAAVAGNGSTIAAIPAAQMIDYYGYDQLGQRTRHWNSQFGSGVVETTDYDMQGRVTSTKDYQGLVTSYSYSWYSIASNLLGAAGLGNFGGWAIGTTNAAGKYSQDNKDYFGRIIWRQDFGGRGYGYTFDKVGHILSQTNTAGQSITFTYYNNGYISSITDTALKMKSTFSYDSEGNRTRESYVTTDAAPNTVYYQNAAITYDALNRVTRFKDAKADITYSYDAASNRRVSIRRGTRAGEILNGYTHAARARF